MSAVCAFLAATQQSQAAWLQAGMPKIVVYAADADALVQLEARSATAAPSLFSPRRGSNSASGWDNQMPGAWPGAGRARRQIDA